ncbi:hypothetical protein J8A87_23070 [Vibrio parahaemolyticus]|uniref:hypothetical protein n=1 Tax=Vibrio sp. Vb0587 TaxID=3074626 RepID=UPI002963FA65|nr:hypothetical protein [Vibrio sp. Vb0587]MBE4779361.1 hypothetical protein [Vibrio parahaemolyticus]MCF9167328.1 hypothetical protein [Vibrio parahaemolyticus]MDW1964035.1 hypothetical protein [Vibrio sp. Vb0587]
MNYKNTVTILNNFSHNTTIEYLLTNLSSSHFEPDDYSHLKSLKNLNVGQAILTLLEKGGEDGDPYCIDVTVSNYLEKKLTREALPLVRKHRNTKDIDVAIACAKVESSLGYLGDSIKILLDHNINSFKTCSHLYTFTIINFASAFCQKSDENASTLEIDLDPTTLTLVECAEKDIDAEFIHQVTKFMVFSTWFYNNAQRIINSSEDLGIDVSTLTIDGEDFLGSLATVTKLVGELPKLCFEGTLKEQKEKIFEKNKVLDSKRISLINLWNFLYSTDESKSFH